MGIRDELREIAEQQRTLPDRRAELVNKARQQNVTWREIAHILNMTEPGLIKAHKAWLARQEPQD